MLRRGPRGARRARRAAGVRPAPRAAQPLRGPHGQHGRAGGRADRARRARRRPHPRRHVPHEHRGGRPVRGAALGRATSSAPSTSATPTATSPAPGTSPSRRSSPRCARSASTACCRSSAGCAASPSRPCASAGSSSVESWAERVYAGVLGKIIGVYLGRPFEQWTHADIEERARRDHRLRDRSPGDRARQARQPAHRHRRRHLRHVHLPARARGLRHADLTTEQIGQTWLNYIIEERSTHLVGRRRHVGGAHRLPSPEGRIRRRQRLDRAERPRWCPSRSARRSSSTGGRWSAPAIPSGPPTSRAAPPA